MFAHIDRGGILPLRSMFPSMFTKASRVHVVLACQLSVLHQAKSRLTFPQISQLNFCPRLRPLTPPDPVPSARGLTSSPSTSISSTSPLPLLSSSSDPPLNWRLKSSSSVPFAGRPWNPFRTGNEAATRPELEIELDRPPGRAATIGREPD